ncbi:MAG: class I SAM-dependent methyltransferase [Pseudomonadota bacterium]
MNQNTKTFYRAFEDRYRGSRELIKSRLAVYLPYVLPLKQFFPDSLGVDLGCGRGEWLELMQENSLNVQGIDLDQGMLEVAHKRGLKVQLGDAIEYLQTLAPESQTIISGFHLAEHLPFEVLQILIQQALRVLKPGGLLILETPNPENIVVGTENFYLDPSHQQPIPSLLLSFMVEHAGFRRVKILRIQESADLADNDSLTLMNVLNGVSPDYAVLAQKGGNEDALAATAIAFNGDYGLSLEKLATCYDIQRKTKEKQAELLAINAEALARQAEAKAQQAEAKAQQAEAKAQQAEAISQLVAIKVQQAIMLAEESARRAQFAEANLDAAVKSLSWKITAPLRLGKRVVKKLLMLPHIRSYISRRPRLKRVALLLLTRLPALKKRLLGIQVQNQNLERQNLSPNARRIYDEIKSSHSARDKRKH